MYSCSSRKINYFCSRFYYNYFYYYLVSAFLAFGICCCYYFYFTEVTFSDKSRLCLKKAFENVTSESFDTEWLKLNDTVEKCNKPFLETLEIQKFPNNDETKLGLLPRTLDSNCNVITLGIGKDVLAEKQISQKLKSCKFLGIDPDFKESGSMYIADLRGVYVQGRIGTITHDNTTTQIRTYFFKDFLAQFYPHQTVDFLLMDIESAEVPLMKELIDYPEMYPAICQINVEYHTPADTNGYSFFKEMARSVQNGPYLPLKVENFSTFNRVFFVNFIDRYCTDKYL